VAATVGFVSENGKDMTRICKASLLLALATITLVAVLVGGYVALIGLSQGEFEIVVLDCGSGREIVITAARSWELTQPIYYSVRVDGKVVVPSYPIDYIQPSENASDLQFTIFSTDDLVGICYAEDTSEYLVVHDFSNNESWPVGSHIQWNDDWSINENIDFKYQRWEAMERKVDAARSANASGE
jgi:hypothetical protein